ncbi:DUF882 domain-containing protein [Leptolyngbya sp. 15MV]|nr:DUF882 domain-containing protein [Leptolyngbya sp. 15MV]
MREGAGDPELYDYAPYRGRAQAQGIARHVWLQNAAGEEAALRYRVGETYDRAAMQRITHLLRDLRAREDGPQAPLLVDMLSVLQEGWDYARPIRVMSGYRTARTNQAAEGAAPASLHLVGWAADIQVPGLPLEFIAAAAWRLSNTVGRLGVGLYASFVHLDIGPRRLWTRLPAG